MNKITIELTAATALNIMGFLLEFEEDYKDDPKCQMLKESIEEFNNQVESNISREQLEDAIKEVQLAILMGKAPDNAKGGSIYKSK